MSSSDTPEIETFVYERIEHTVYAPIELTTEQAQNYFESALHGEELPPGIRVEMNTDGQWLDGPV